MQEEKKITITGEIEEGSFLFHSSSSSYYEGESAIKEIFGLIHRQQYDKIIYPFSSTYHVFARAKKIKEDNVFEKKEKEIIKEEDLFVSEEDLSKIVRAFSLSSFSSLSNKEILSKQIKAIINAADPNLEEAIEDKSFYDEIVESIIKKICLRLKTKGKKKVKTKEKVTELIPHKHISFFFSIPLSSINYYAQKSEEEVEVEVEVVFKDSSSEIMILLQPLLEWLKKKKENVKKWRSEGVKKEERDWIPKGETIPYDHQWISYKTHLELNCGADLSDMGVGKTLSMLMMLDKRIEKGEIRKGHVLVVAPSIGCENWMKEIKKHTPNLSGEVISGSYQERMNRFLAPDSERGDILIMNYEAFAMKTKEKVTDESGNSREIEIPLSMLTRFVDWDCVILDECHKIKNPDAQRTKNIIEAFNDIKYKYIMSGTISANNIYDIHCPFIFLNRAKLFNPIQTYQKDGTLLPYTHLHSEFKSTFFTRNGYKLIPRRGVVKKIRSLMEEISVRFTKDECLSLPPKVYEKIYVQMHPLQKELYLKLKNLLAAELSDIAKSGSRVTAMNVLAKMMKLAEAANGWIYDDQHQLIRFPFNPKWDAIKEKLEEIRILTKEEKNQIKSENGSENGSENEREDVSKVVIWTRFIPDTHMLVKNLRQIYGEESVAVIHGGDHCLECGARKDQRANIQQKFNDLKSNLQILVVTSATASHAVDFTGANYEFYLSNSFVKTDRSQSEDRCHRAEMRKSLTIIDFIAKDTIDEAIFVALTSWKGMCMALLEDLGIDPQDLGIRNDSSQDEKPTIEIKLQKQPEGSRECLLASCAMIAHKNIDQAREESKILFQHDWIPDVENARILLNHWKIKYEEVFDLPDKNGSGIILIRYGKSLKGHAVAFDKGIVYDPAKESPVNFVDWMGKITEVDGNFTKIFRLC